MLQGSHIGLRPVRQADLDALYEAHVAIDARGSYFPLGRHVRTGVPARVRGARLLAEDRGHAGDRDAEGEIAGHIEFFRPVSYWDAFELSYQLYDERHAGLGYTTEAVQLLVDYLFATKKEHRIHLVIAVGNEASQRIADKCGFTWRERCAAPSSTTAGTRTSCSTAW